MIRVGDCLVDPAVGTISQADYCTQVGPKVMNVLLYLAGRPGEVLSREQILSSVWSDRNVSDDVLTQAITVLRKALGDDPREPQMIQTLPKRGYRLIAEVQSPSHPRPSRTARITRFTIDEGVKREPKISPDGEKVAYVWSGASRDNWDIYVKAMGAGAEALRLTNDPAEDRSPVWSPDGRVIAFVRVPPFQTPASGDEAAIYLIPSLGGRERRLVRISGEVYANEYFLPKLSWSLDGRHVAFGERPSHDVPARIVRLRLDTLEKEQLTSPPAGSLGDYAPEFSPDGKEIVFIRIGSEVWGNQDLWTLCLKTGVSRKLTNQGYSEVSQPVWHKDTNRIQFVSDTGAWEINPAGGIPQLIPGLGRAAGELSVWKDRLVHVETAGGDISVWRMPGRLNRDNDRSLRRILHGSWPTLSPDGSRVACASNRTGIFNIWVCETDGSNSIQLTDSTVSSAAPNWAPDGTRLVFDSTDCGNGDIFMVSLEGGPPHRLTRGPAANVLPTWSRDGEWIYFQSTQTGRAEIWKIPVEGGPALQITSEGGYYGVEGVDGHSLFFTRREVSGLWKMPVAGGPEIRVFDEDVFYSHWALAETGIYFINCRALGQHWEYRLNFFDFRTHEICQLVTEEGPWRPGMIDVSPDEQWIVCAREKPPVSELILVENFG